MTRPSIHAVVVFATLVAAIGYLTFSAKDRGVGPSIAVEAAAAAVEPTQLDSIPSAHGDHPAPYSTRKRPVREEDGPVTAAQTAAKQEDRMWKLDAEFMAEPVSAGWAASTERVFDSAFSDENLASKGAPAPVAHDVSCRMFTCRVEVTYADEVQADTGMQFMLGDVAALLPKAKHVRFDRPDGSVQWIAYMNTGRPRR